MKDTQENPSFKHAEDRYFFFPHSSSIFGRYSRVPSLSLSRINRAESTLRRQKIAKVFVLFRYVSIFPRFLLAREQKRRISPTLQGKYTICRVENGIPSNICVAYFPPWENAPSERRVFSLKWVGVKGRRGEGRGRGWGRDIIWSNDAHIESIFFCRVTLVFFFYFYIEYSLADAFYRLRYRVIRVSITITFFLLYFFVRVRQ